MPVPPRRPSRLQGRIFRGSHAVSLGLLTRAELRSSAWRSLFRDIYADARLVVSHPARCAAAARWLVPPGAAIAGRSAAALFGAGRVEAHESLDILTPTTQRFGPVAGLTVHTATLPSTDVALRAGVPVTTPERTCWDLAQWLRVEDAVALVDVLVRRRLVEPAQLAARARRHTGERGWRRMLRVADLTDGGAESPPESRLRVRLVLAGLPAPVTQFVVERNGAFVARLDLAWPQWKIAIEYDGIWHHDPDQLHRDRRRLNRLVGDDWIVLHLTSKRFATEFCAFPPRLTE